MKAETDSAREGSKARKPRGKYYVPAAHLAPVDGVQKGPGAYWWCDSYSGPADALAASGILPRELMPGEPGAPLASATYRPQGVPVHKRQHLTPGYVQAFRRPNGTVRVELTVSVEEQERREAESKAADERERVSRSAVPTRWQAATFTEDDSYTVARAVTQLMREHGGAAVIRHLAQFPGARPRRPAPEYLRLVWAAPNC